MGSLANALHRRFVQAFYCLQWRLGNIDHRRLFRFLTLAEQAQPGTYRILVNDGNRSRESQKIADDRLSRQLQCASRRGSVYDDVELYWFRCCETTIERPYVAYQLGSETMPLSREVVIGAAVRQDIRSRFWP